MEQKATYLVETWRDQPTLEVLEDDFNTVNIEDIDETLKEVIGEKE